MLSTFNVNIVATLKTLGYADQKGLLRQPEIKEKWVAILRPHAANPLVKDNEVVRKWNLVMETVKATVAKPETVLEKMEIVAHEPGHDNKTGISHNGGCLVAYLINASIAARKDGRNKKAIDLLNRASKHVHQMFPDWKQAEFAGVPEGLLATVTLEFAKSISSMISPMYHTCDCRAPKCPKCGSHDFHKAGLVAKGADKGKQRMLCSRKTGCGRYSVQK